MACGDVLLINLPASDGREQSGRRPAVAVQTDLVGEPLLMVAPVTSKLSVLRFAFSVRIEPTAENGLTAPSVVMVFQMRAVDKARIVRKIGQLSAADLARVEAEIWRVLKPGVDVQHFVVEILAVRPEALLDFALRSPDRDELQETGVERVRRRAHLLGLLPETAHHSLAALEP